MREWVEPQMIGVYVMCRQLLLDVHVLLQLLEERQNAVLAHHYQALRPFLIITHPILRHKRFYTLC